MHSRSCAWIPSLLSTAGSSALRVFVATSPMMMLALTSCQSPEVSNSENNDLRATIVALQATVVTGNVPSPSSAPPQPTIEIVETPQPSNTSAPGALEVGEAWMEDGFTLRLSSATTTLAYGDRIGPGIKVLFELTNTTTDNLPIRYGQENFSAEDNLGNRIEFGQAHQHNGYFAPVDAHEAMLNSNESIRLPLGSIRSVFYVSCDIADPEITDAFVTVQDLGRISRAVFRIRIPH